MLQPAYASKIINQAHLLDVARRELQALSSETLSASKRAIFAFHRDDQISAKAQLLTAQAGIKRAQQLIKRQPRLAQEGAWRAAQEEYAEAELFQQYLSHRQVTFVRGIQDDGEIFIGALSDLTGELTRRAVRLASQQNIVEVEQIFEDVNEAVAFLLQMDLTGGLRSKVDQARQNLRKLEEIRYDLAIHRRVDA